MFLDIALDSAGELAQRREVAAYLAAAFDRDLFLDEALARVDSRDAGDRQVAALLLGAPGNLRAVFPLVALLDDPAVDVRRAAVRGLAGIRDHRVLSFLLGVLDRDDELVATTLNALTVFELDSTRPLFDLYLDSADHETSLAALGAFRFAPSAIAAPRAVRFLTHAEPRLRSLAVSILEQSGQRRFLEPLFPLLGDPDTRVRQLAHEAIAAIRAAR